MTTVATDGKTIASDSLQQGVHIDQVVCKKIHRVKGAVVGLAGDVQDGKKFLSWLRGGDKADLSNNFEALVVDGGVAYHYTDHIPVNAGLPAAIGSGAGYAMAAMLAGCSPREAVKIAIKLDIGSRGPVREMKL